jgi:hypothetical protein
VAGGVGVEPIPTPLIRRFIFSALVTRLLNKIEGKHAFYCTFLAVSLFLNFQIFYVPVYEKPSKNLTFEGLTEPNKKENRAIVSLALLVVIL